MDESDLKKLFPLLSRHNIHYFDYAATTPMPKEVIDEWVAFQSSIGVSSGRSSGILTALATEKLHLFEKKLLTFFCAEQREKIVYGKNVTELVNIMAYAIEDYVCAMDVILIGPYEHHSNFLPWKYLAKRRDAIFYEIPIDKNGVPDWDYIEKIKGRIKIFACSEVSNVSGIEVNLDEILPLLPSDTFVFIDESQVVGHRRLKKNPRIDCMFVPSHKMYGPKNIAASIINERLLEKMRPVLLGGGMIDYCGFIDTWKIGREGFLAGTLDIGLIAAWVKACDFLKRIGFNEIHDMESRHHKDISSFLAASKNFSVVWGTSTSIISIYHHSLHAHDIAHVLAKKNIIIRAGHMCASGVLRKFERHSIVRISFGLGITDSDKSVLLNSLEDVDNEY